jgi:hypothetical protein
VLKFFRRLFKKRSVWIYGYCHGGVARRHRIYGNVQFVLWPAGTQGHIVDYWHDMNSYWWPQFTTTAPVNFSEPATSPNVVHVQK